MAKKTKAQVEFEAKTSGFTSGIKSMDQSLGTLRKELRLNSTELKGNADDVDLLTKRKELLQQESEASAKKVELLGKKLSEAERLFGESSNEVRLLNNQLLDARNVFQGIQNEINDVNSKLNKFGAETSGTISDLDRLTSEINAQEKELADLKSEYTNVVLAQGKSSSEAKELASKMSSLNSELQENQTKLSKAESASDKFTSSLKQIKSGADNADDGFTVLKGTLADLGANVISSVVSSISGLVSSLFELGEATEEYRMMQAKLSGSSKTFGYDMEFANEKYEEFYRYLGDDQMATNAITNLMGLGTSTENITALCEGATAVWATYGDSIPIESFTEATNETIQVGKVTGTFADAINWAKISNDELSKSFGEGSKAQKAFNQAIKDGETQEDAFSAALGATSDQQERANMVATFLNSTYGESKAKYDEMTGSIQNANSAELDLKETQSQMAEAIAPVNGALSSLKNDALEAMLPIVQSLSDAFMEFKGWLEEHPVVADILKVALITLTAVIGTLTAVVVGWTIAQWALNSAILANPITWIIVAIVAGITALIAVVVLVIKYWDEIKEACLNAWNKIKEVLGTIADWFNTNVVQPVIKFFKELWEGIKDIWEGAKSVFGTVANWINDKVIQPVLDFFKGLWNGIKAVWDGICNVIKVAGMFIVELIKGWFNLITLPFRFIWENCKEYIFAAWEWIKEKVSTAVNAVKNVITTVFNAVKNFFSTVWNGIKTIFTNVWNGIVNFITPIVNNIKNTITTVFNNVKNTVSTIFNAIKSVASSVWNAIKNTISSVINTIKSVITSVFNAIKSFASSVWNGIKTVIINPIKNAYNTVKSTANNIKNSIVNTFNNVKSRVTSIFNNVKTAITKPIESARDKVKSIVDKIKSFFTGLKLKLPDIKLPHFKITGKLSLNPPSVPKLKIDWYKDGGIMTKPTMFGMNGLSPMVGGEAGAEAILPLSRLEDWINRGFNQVVNNNYYANDRIERLIELTEEMLNKPNDIYIDKTKIGGALAETNDNFSGQRVNFRSRGVII